MTWLLVTLWVSLSLAVEGHQSQLAELYRIRQQQDNLENKVTWVNPATRLEI